MKYARSLLTAILCGLLLFSCACAESMLVLPGRTTVIEAEAFLNCATLGKVVLPEGITRIESRSFAGSSLTAINLPESLTYIADDAFADCPYTIFISASKGTYAYNWAVRTGYIGTQKLEGILVDLPTLSYNHNAYQATIDVTSTYRIPYTLSPWNAKNDLVWTCYDPELAIVDQTGLVTPLKAGYAYIEVYSPSTGVRTSVMLIIEGAHYTSEGLSYTFSADKAGYLVSACSAEAVRVTIPAQYNGLPVVGIVPGAFKDCSQLTDIRLEAGHTVLYMEDGAVYANLPRRTLMCYPARHAPNGHLYIPEGTLDVAAYAFSQCTLSYITVPESLTTIGDCAFYSLQYQLGVFMTDQVSVFGTSLFQNQRSNGYFFAPSWDSPAALYAEKYNIPCGVYMDRTPEPLPEATPTPAPTAVPDFPAVDENKRVLMTELAEVNCEWLDTSVARYELAAYEKAGVSEVLLEIQDQWRNVKYYEGRSQQTGLYGAGYTAQAAILRAYDDQNNLLGARQVQGHFSFSFDGARKLGVAGGSGTVLSVIPTKPVFVSSPGRYPIQPETWHRWQKGNIYQYYILEMHMPTHHLEFPQHLNILGYFSKNAITGRSNEDSLQMSEGYTIIGFNTSDSTRTDQLGVVTIVLDRQECLMHNDYFSCYATTLQERSPNLGDSLYQVYQNTRSIMLSGGHYPADQAVSPVQVRINGQYPSAFLSIVSLDNAYLIFDEYDACSVSHELVHAIDQGLPGNGYNLFPSPWLEGRAEYISEQFCAQLGLPYTSSTYGDGKDADWSLVSQEDRQDFFRFYYESSNRISTYFIGYHFYSFLVDTYGSDVGARIMRNAATAGYDYWEPEVTMNAFKKCVEDATEPGVFQRFVSDVINASGT